MTHGRPLLIALILLVGSLAPLYAQAPDHASAAAQLVRYETLLASGGAISPSDVASIEQLEAEIKSAGFGDLSSRAEIVLALARERVQSKAASDALSRDIRDQVAIMRSEQNQRIKNGIASAGLWTAVGGFGTGVLASTFSSWAYDKFYSTTYAPTAQNYFLAGRVSDLVAISALAAGGLGLGVLGFELFGLYSTPVPPGASLAVAFPPTVTTKEQRIAYLDSTLKGYAQQYDRSVRARSIGTTSFVAGLSALALTAILLAVTQNTFQLYNEAAANVDATTLREQVAILQWVSVGTGTLAAAGIGGGLASLYLYPDPAQLLSASSNVHSQREALVAGD